MDSRYNLQNNHPLIPNANTYICQKKYVSIDSQDRDSLKYPASSQFEIELPQDYLNVQTVRLSQWSFPANYNSFSAGQTNIKFIFKMANVYNPEDHELTDRLLSAIYAALSSNDYSYTFTIEVETGFYNPTQMQTELTNKMNESVTNYLISFFKDNPAFNYALELFNEYSDFVVVYNSVTQKLVFGNRNSGFIFPNDANEYQVDVIKERSGCRASRSAPSFADWGMPAFIGFTRCRESSIIGYNVNQYRFYYGNVLSFGDNGIWIKPSNLPGAYVHYIKAPLKINFMGSAYIYLELDGQPSLNCIDETNPYNLSPFTTQTNQTNGVVNSAFAKIAVPTTPISQWFDDDMTPYKWFDPPAERIRKLKIKLRYHNGQLVDFAAFNWSIMLEFTMLTNQIERSSSITKFCVT